MIVLSYGGGTDSTALLVEAHRRGIRPDLIVFADTGSEHPRTYAYLSTLRAWLAEVGFPDLTITRWIRRDGSFLPLHAACIERRELPSAAYGHAGCSAKWKRQPVDRLVDTHPEVQAALARGELVERWVGYSADEEHRIGRLPPQGPGQPYRWRAPLAEWGIDRAAARQAIACAGLPLPGKSSCWMCPHSRPAEVQALRAEHPDLYDAACGIEAGADLTAIRGLGRTWRWSELPLSLLPPRLTDLEELPCSCATKRQRRPAPSIRRRTYRPRAARLDSWRWALGVVPAADVARLAGVSVATVRKMAARQAGSASRALLT